MPTKPHTKIPQVPKILNKLEEYSDSPWVIDTETNGLKVIGPESQHTAHWVGFMPAVEGEEPFAVTIGVFNKFLRPLFENLALIGHNIRFDLHALNLEPIRPIWDTMGYTYIHNTTALKSLDALAELRGWDKIKTPPEIKAGKISSLDSAKVREYLIDDVIITFKLYLEQRKQKSRVFPTFIKDMNLERALARIQARGVRLLTDKMSMVTREARRSLGVVTKELELMGFRGNLGSSKQLAAWLTENGRVLPRTEKGNPSTSREVIQDFADKGDTFAARLLDHRKISKLIQGFLVPLPQLARRNSYDDYFYLYPEINSTRTATGRFSYSNPNLQQIPKGRQSTIGKKIRQCLTHEGGVSVADYRQIELRIAAALSGEPVLLEAFGSGRDPHTETAAKVFGKELDKVSDIERHAAKTVNFGILFGAGPNRLAIELGVSIQEARQVFHDWKTGLSCMSNWCEETWASTEASRVAQTVGGRTRIFGPGENARAGLSVVVQGTAAELMRQALLDAEIAGLDPILTVHDEIILKGRGKAQELSESMQKSAEKAFPDRLGSVNFPVDGSDGPSWGEIE